MLFWCYLIAYWVVVVWVLNIRFSQAFHPTLVLCYNVDDVFWQNTQRRQHPSWQPVELHLGWERKKKEAKPFGGASFLFDVFHSKKDSLGESLRDDLPSSDELFYSNTSRKGRSGSLVALLKSHVDSDVSRPIIHLTCSKLMFFPRAFQWKNHRNGMSYDRLMACWSQESFSVWMAVYSKEGERWKIKQTKMIGLLNKEMKRATLQVNSGATIKTNSATINTNIETIKRQLETIKIQSQ